MVKAPTPFSIGTALASHHQQQQLSGGRQVSRPCNGGGLAGAIARSSAGASGRDALCFGDTVFPVKMNSWNLKLNTPPGKRNIIIHPPPFLGFEMLVLGGCFGLITWIEWKEREAYRVGGLLPPYLLGKNDGKWIQFEKTTYFLIGLKLENTK